MSRRNVILVGTGSVAVATSALAGVMIRLLLTEPVMVANAVTGRDLVPLFWAVTETFDRVLTALFRYL